MNGLSIPHCGAAGKGKRPFAPRTPRTAYRPYLWTDKNWFVRRGVMGDHTPVPLTRSEYLICEYVVRNKGQVFSKEQIYEAVFGLEGDSDNSTISTHIKNIRAKLDKWDIQPYSCRKQYGLSYLCGLFRMQSKKSCPCHCRNSGFNKCIASWDVSI